MKKLDGRAFDAALAEMFLIGRTGNEGRDKWTVPTKYPFVSHLSMLATLTVTLTNFLKSDCTARYGKEPMAYIRDRLDRIHSRGQAIWRKTLKEPDDVARNAQLKDNKWLRGQVAGLERYCKGLFPGRFEGVLLSSYTDSVQDSLAGLTLHMSKLLKAYEMSLVESKKTGTLSATVALTQLAGGLVGRDQLTKEELLVAGGIAALGALEPEDELGTEADLNNKIAQQFKNLSGCLPH